MRAKKIVGFRRQRKNPFFREPSSAVRWRHVGRGTLLCVVFALVAVGLLAPRALYSTRYTIQDGTAETVRTTELLVEQWLASRQFFIPRSHKLFGSPSSLERALMDSGRFHSVHVSRKDGALHIAFDERLTRYYVLHEEVLYEMDREGRIIARVDDVERIQLTVSGALDRFPLLELPSSFDVQQATDPQSVDRLNAALLAMEGLRRQTLLTPTRAELTDDPNRMNVFTDVGPAVYMALDRDIEPQIAKLEALLSKQLVDISALTYIDLRYENRLYYH